MSEILVKGFTVPDEVKVVSGRCTVQTLHLGPSSITRTVLAPGWRWSVDNRPAAGTDRCQVHHLGYVVSGRMGVSLNGRPATEIGVGDIVDIPPGHDAWTIGDEPCVFMDFVAHQPPAETPAAAAPALA